jgi:hypothetical protein
MTHSSFEPDPAVTKDLAKAVMWTYHGREFPAPTFELGMAPAGSMYSTATDLGRFLSVLFAGGKGPSGAVVRPETLERMWAPQFSGPDEKKGFGIGFMIDELEGKRRIGHGGAIYGFATELAALPSEKLGAVVIASRDVTNAVTTRIADTALRLMLAARQGRPLPAVEETAPLDPAKARKLAGRWKGGDKTLDLYERDGRLFLLPGRGGFRVEVRASGDALVVDDRLAYGQRLEVQDDGLKVGKDIYERQKEELPPEPPVKWLGLIGEYGWDHNTLFILEKDGKLHALIEWFFLYPLEEVSADEYRFPDFGLYHGEKVVFTRGPGGRATSALAAGVAFERRRIDGENGETYRITPVRPVDELRREALAAKPPQEKRDFRKPELVDLTTLDKTIKLDIRYAGTNNFVGTPFYTSARAFLRHWCGYTGSWRPRVTGCWFSTRTGRGR